MSNAYNVPLRQPAPDFQTFREVLLGKKPAKKVHLVELIFDREIIEAVVRECLGKVPVPSEDADFSTYWDQRIAFWYRLGYDYIRVDGGVLVPFSQTKTGHDSSEVFQGSREWVDEGFGPIQSWKDFEQYPWEVMEFQHLRHFEYVSRHLPEGMKMMVCPCSGVFEISAESMLGFEGMSYLLYENPELVQAVFDKVGSILLQFYQNVSGMDNVAGFFQGDDLGYKTSTFLSPMHLRKLVFPWHRKFRDLAHSRDQMYWLHCCGNVQKVFPEMLETIGMDAFHSFQDAILPVDQFQQRYGDQLATLGGLDVDILVRGDERQVRQATRNILQRCMPNRYAFGSGNSIANYIPLANFLAMLDEATRWER
ncbi:MAG TPA: uroporphyrinogen decarboxylase family protein [Thermotogota bacterium]|nr:uroporphyrinogen decarboxylase family protein [Thermotogota bacterium]